MRSRATRAGASVEVALHSTGVRDALQPQDGLYTLAMLDEQSQLLRVIGAIRNCWSRPSRRLQSSIASPIRRRSSSPRPSPRKAIACAATARSIFAHPDIAHDRRAPRRAAHTDRLSGAGLRVRRALGLPPPNDHQLRQPRRQRSAFAASGRRTSRATAIADLARVDRRRGAVSFARWSTASRLRRTTRCARIVAATSRRRRSLAGAARIRSRNG